MSGKIFKILCVIIVGALCLVYGNDAKTQNVPQNSPKYDTKPVIFGWYVGFNTMYSTLSGKKNIPYNDTIMAFHSNTKVGAQIGVLADLRIFSFLNLRFLPNISFSDRNFTFLIKDGDKFREANQNFEVIYLDLPIEFKLSAKRWNNFRPYVLGGMKYDYDMGSIRRKKIGDNEFLFKINESELFYTLGVGFDFYFSFFKMTLEIKNSFGLTDVLNKDYKTVYSDCIEKMKSQMFSINLIFQ